jgi:hypothetical protein
MSGLDGSENGTVEGELPMRQGSASHPIRERRLPWYLRHAFINNAVRELCGLTAQLGNCRSLDKPAAPQPTDRVQSCISPPIFADNVAEFVGYDDTMFPGHCNPRLQHVPDKRVMFEARERRTSAVHYCVNDHLLLATSIACGDEELVT